MSQSLFSCQRTGHHSNSSNILRYCSFCFWDTNNVSDDTTKYHTMWSSAIITMSSMLRDYKEREPLPFNIIQPGKV